MSSPDSSPRTGLLCIVTALELLSGQGEAINIDLAAFVGYLYSTILPGMTLDTGIEEKHYDELSTPSIRKVKNAYSTLTSSDLLFRSLSSIFLNTRIPNPPTRTLAFSKRLLISSLHWPKATALKSVQFVRQLLVKERCLETMLSTEDRRRDGVYRYEASEEGLSNPEATVWWELTLLEGRHYDEEVRAEAGRVARWTKDS